MDGLADEVREADRVRAIRSNDRIRCAGWTASGAGSEALRRASGPPVPGECMGEQHACERQHRKCWPVRSETMDGESVAARTARPTEKVVAGISLGLIHRPALPS